MSRMDTDHNIFGVEDLMMTAAKDLRKGFQEETIDIAMKVQIRQINKICHSYCSKVVQDDTRALANVKREKVRILEIL